MVTDPVLDWVGACPRGRALRAAAGKRYPDALACAPGLARDVRTAWARGRSLVCHGLCEAVHPTSAWACAGEVE